MPRTDRGFVHMGISAGWLHGMISLHGNDPPILVHDDGRPMTQSEALAELQKNPDAVFPMGDCDNWDDREQRCLGHDPK